MYKDNNIKKLENLMCVFAPLSSISTLLSPSALCPHMNKTQHTYICIHVLQLGTHLTMLTHAVFCEIPCTEFLDKRYGKDKSYSPRFHLLKWLTQNIQYVLLSEIVRKVDMRERAQVCVMK
jgi:hypothetical protein